MNEKNVKIIFEGFVIDAFITGDGSLGMTVERTPFHEGNHFVDIYVDKDTLAVRSV